MPTSWNIFSIGRTRGAEDQLTEMLVWLATVVPDVASAVARLAIEDEAVDVSGLETATQHGIVGGRLDAFFVSPSIAIIVESKLGAEYGDNQLRRYAEWLSETAQADGRVCALMTLTQRPAPWPSDDEAYARARKVIPAARRWEELHARLTPLSEEADRDPLAARLITEFLEMLAEEGLIPMLPLNQDELSSAWRDGRKVIRRYHKFLRACKSDIAEALGADPISNSWSEHFNWVWQDYKDAEGTRIAVGFHYTDEGFPLTPRIYTGAPVVWLAVKSAQRDDWQQLAAALAANPPDGWNSHAWWDRPRIWRLSAEVIGEGTFDEQRERLAEASALARAWVARAEAAIVAGGETTSTV